MLSPAHILLDPCTLRQSDHFRARPIYIFFSLNTIALSVYSASQKLIYAKCYLD